MLIFLIILTGSIFLLVFLNFLFWPKAQNIARHSARLSVSVCVPARNEAQNIANCLMSLGIDSDLILEVLVLNDDSQDSTADIIARFVSQYPKIRLISTQALPRGWTGKNFACYQLAKAAKGDLILFLDADARVLTGGLNILVSEMEIRGLDLLSAWPAYRLISLSEKTFMPLLNYVVLSLFPAPLSLTSRLPALGLAHGACILVKRQSYWQMGGHSAVKGDLFEDTSLARSFRRAGLLTACLDGSSVVRVRMYRNLGEIFLGFQKNFYPAFKFKPLFWLFILLHIISLYIFVYAGLNFSWPALTPALLLILARGLLAIRFQHSWLSVLLHPLAEMFLLVVGLSSMYKIIFKQGVVWKGRIYEN